RVRQLLDESVHNRLLGDVPMGVLLSGGLDSTTVLALLSDRVSELTSFSVGFPEHPDLDEREEARAVAKHFGIRHLEVTVSERDPRAHMNQIARGIARGRLAPMHSSVGMSDRQTRDLLTGNSNGSAPGWTLTDDDLNNGADLLAFDTQEFEFGIRLPELLLMR